MAEQIETAAIKVAPKKAAAKRKPIARKTAPKKVAPKKVAAKKTRKKNSKKASPDFANRAQEAGRNAFLASLGFYGKAFDQAQDQFNTLQDQLEERRAKADKSYKELVKRGTKVEKNAKGAIKDIEFPKFDLDSLTDRAKLEAQLDKAKARFEELKASVSFKTAA
ncbi:MAG: hypothetical protein ACJAYC_000385 [Halieaceae bacterium]|jgi:hypothetical protein